MQKRNLRYIPALLALTLSPALLGVACDPVDLGGNPDAGRASGDASSPATDAGATMADAGFADASAADAGSTGTGEVVPRAYPIVFDVFDGAEHQLTFDLEITVDDPSDVPHDVRPRRLELLDGAGASIETYALDASPIPSTPRGSARPALQVYRRFVATARRAGVPGPLGSACASDRFPSRLLTQAVRVVVDVDAVERTIEQRVPAGTGGYPPLRPLVLCHAGITVERHYDPFSAGGHLWMLRRPDGLYDADMWESVGASTYASAPVRSVDPNVRVLPYSARFWPSYFPAFDAPMTGPSFCGSAGCSVRDAMTRYIGGSSAPPLEIAGAMSTFWCREPNAGEPSVSGSERWPMASFDGWMCQHGGSPSGDGMGLARFSGTTDAGAFAAEMIIEGASWKFGDPPLR